MDREIELTASELVGGLIIALSPVVLAIATSSELAPLAEHTGRVLIYRTDKGGFGYTTVEPNEQGEVTKESTAAAKVAYEKANSTHEIVGAYEMQAGNPSPVIRASWNQADGQQSHDFESPDAAMNHARTLSAAGNEEAAKEIYLQTVDQVAPRMEELDLMDDRVVDRGTIMRNAITRGDLEKMGLEAKEIEGGWEVRAANGLTARIAFDRIAPPDAEGMRSWLDSALTNNLISQEEFDQADTYEKQMALYGRGQSAGLTLRLNGKELDPDWLIQLDLNANMNTFRHEWLHVLRGAGVISEQEWAQITEEAGNKDRLKALAAARKENDAEAIARLEGQLEEDVALHIENRLNRRLHEEGESRLSHKILEVLDQLRLLFRKLNASGLSRAIHGGGLGKRKIQFTENQRKASDFILSSLDNSSLDKAVVYRPVSAREVKDVLDQGGPDISHLSHEMVPGHFRHALKSHKDPEREARHKKPQRPLTREDMERLPLVLDHYDHLQFKKKAEPNRSSIQYRKQFKDGVIVYVEQVIETSRKGKPRLSTRTAWVHAPAGVKSGPTSVYTPKGIRKDSSQSGAGQQGMYSVQPEAQHRFQWMRNKEGGQEYGNKQIIVKLTEKIFKEDIAPLLRTGYAKTLREYQAKHPDETHATFVDVGGRGKWEFSGVGSLNELWPSPENSDWVKEVNSFGSKEARRQGGTADSGVKYSVQPEGREEEPPTEFISNIPSSMNRNIQAEFYSRVLKALEGMELKKATMREWMARLEKFRARGQGEGYSSEEIEELDLDALPPNKVMSKEELLGHIQFQPVPEVRFEGRGAGGMMEHDEDQIEQQLDDLKPKLTRLESEYYQLMEDHQSGGIDGQAFLEQREQMEGEMSWMRENLSHLMYLLEARREVAPHHDINVPGRDDKQDEYGIMFLTSPSAEGFRGSHFAGEVNDMVGWMRFNTTEDTLEVIEVQSDLHQKGQREGYRAKEHKNPWQDTKWEEDESFTKHLSDQEALEVANRTGRMISVGAWKTSVSVNADNGIPARWMIQRVVYPEDAITPPNLRVGFNVYPPDMVNGGSRTLPKWLYHRTRGGAEEAVREKGHEFIDWFDLPGTPRATNRSNWHELLFRNAARYAAANGLKYISWPKHWQQVAEIEGHPVGSKPRDQLRPIYKRMTDGLTKEAKRLAKKYGAKVGTRRSSAVVPSGRPSMAAYLEAHPEEGVKLLKANQGKIEPYFERRMNLSFNEIIDRAKTGKLSLFAWMTYVVVPLEWVNDTAYVDLNKRAAAWANKNASKWDFNSLELTPAMGAGPIARYSVQGSESPELKVIRAKVASLLDKYDEGHDDIQTVTDVADELRGIIAEEDVYELEDALTELDRAIQEDWDWAGRGGFREYGETAFLKKLDDFSKVPKGGQYSVQKTLTPVMERIKPVTKDSIVDAPVPGKINENLAKLDELHKQFPNPLESEETWREFYAHVSGADWVVKPPYKALDYASGKQDPADILGSMSEAQIESRLAGARLGELIKKAYESGKAKPADTAMFFLWSILSRQKAVFHQETAFMQAIEAGAHKWIDMAARGKFDEKALKKYLNWVQKTLPAGSPGRAALDNLNSFGRNFLTVMGRKIPKNDSVTPEFAGKSRLAAWHSIMSDASLTGRQKRRKMVAVAYASGQGIGVGLKVISFTLLVTGNTDVFILDRVQVRHLWDARDRIDEFGGTSNIYSNGMAEMVDGLRGLAIYEALEEGLKKSVKAAYKKLGRGKSFNMGGFHWDSWIADSLQEVDHGTVNYLIKKLTGSRRPMNYIGVREGRYNFWDRGIWYISAPQGTERMIQDGSGQWFLLYENNYRNYIGALKNGAAKKTYEGKRVLPLGTKISKIKQPWSETEGYDQEAHDEVIAAYGSRLNSRQSDRLSAAFRSERGRYSVQGGEQPLTPQAQARINHIEAAGQHHAPPPEAAPAYGSGYLADFQKRHLARASQKLVYYAGKKAGQEKGMLQVEEAYAAAAVRKAQAQVIKDLTGAAYDSQKGFKLPKWMGVGKWARRLNTFLDKSIHLAAHLNAVSRDEAGNMVFSDFQMRAGLMSQKQFGKGNHQLGDKVMVVNPLTGENDELEIGAFISTTDGRQGYQLFRNMSAAMQGEVYKHFREEYPDLIWAIDMYIDPALKDTRQVINGVEVPMLNRFSLERMLAESDPSFDGVQGYTPDVVATRSLVGGLLGVFNVREGNRSPGRRYKTGRTRESGNVKDLFTGHTVRAFQALQEKHRQQFTQVVLKHAAKPLEKGEGPGNLPEGWVMLEDGMTQVIQRVKAFKDFIEDENFDGPAFYKKFMGKLYAARGRQMKIRREAVEVLMQQYIRFQFNNKLYNLGAWAVRNSKGMLLAHPGTMVVNAATNDLFTFEAAFQNLLKGISLLPVDAKKGKIAMRQAKEMMVSNFLFRFPSLRKLAGISTHYDEVVEEAIPEELFSSSVNLQDLEVKYETTAGQYIREGEIGAASLQLIQYGNIDIRAKQRMTYAFLKAHAVQEAKDQGLRGQEMKDFVDRWMKNPPRDIMVQAVESANFEFLNYADSPAWLQWFSSTPYTALIMPFPRFGYHFMAKQIDKAVAVRKLVQKVPAEERAEAFGKVMAFSMFGVGGAGLLIDAILRWGDDDDDARERIGTSYVKYTDPVTGQTRTKQLDRQMITTARVNLSWYARKMGLGNPDTEDDFWWRVRNYPMIAMAGNLILAADDAEKHGAWEGAKTLVRSTTDLGKDFFSLGAGVKVPSKVWAEIHSEPGKPKREPAFDPYATNVPLGFYLTEQGLTSLVPGVRQFNDLSVLVEPDRPKKTASKALDYEPGTWEALRANHVGAVLSRWAEKRGLIKPMPRQGSVKTMTVLPRKADDLQRQVDRAQALGKLDGPEANIFIDPRTYRPRLATIPEGSIAERTRKLELLRILGLNLKPVPRGAYGEQLETPLPTLPGTGN